MGLRRICVKLSPLPQVKGMTPGLVWWEHSGEYKGSLSPGERGELRRGQMVLRCSQEEGPAPRDLLGEKPQLGDRKGL